MNILEHIYEINFHKINFLERKISILHPNTVLVGSPKSGKSYLIYDYLSQFEDNQYLYINFDDYKNNFTQIAKNLDLFVKKNNISVLILENYKFNLNLPKVTSTIITTYEKNSITGFDKLFVKPLDFEEFLLFDTKHQNILNSFNSFLKFGNSPEVLEYGEQKKAQRNFEICKLYCQDNTQLEILLIIIKFSTEKKSLFQLFTTLKKEIKISKDKFYKTCEEFERNKVIYFCSKFEQPKAVKKIFVFNHALLDITSYKKNFNNLFKNMVFLEIEKRYAAISYLDNIDFYIAEKDHIILSIPFFNDLISSSIISKVIPIVEEYDIKYISIVTVNSEKSIFIGEIEAQILPFYSWVLTL